MSNSPMSFALRNTITKKEISISRKRYSVILDLAEDFGWEPQGTESNIPDYVDWDRYDYLSNYEQIITPQDGALLAAALKKAAKETSGRRNVLFTTDQLHEMSQFFADGNIQILNKPPELDGKTIFLVEC